MLQRSFNEYEILFRWYENGREMGDFPLVTGTMNPREITQGNQIAILVVDIDQSKNLLEEYKNFKAKRADGETIPFAMWAPDGAEGRFVIEREKFYIDPWAQSKASNRTFWLTIGGIVLVSLIVAIFVPCIIFVLPLVIGPIAFLMKKSGKTLKGNQVSYEEYFSIIQRWMNQMSSDGTIQRKFLGAFGITESNSDARL